MGIDPYNLGTPVFKEDQVITLTDIDYFINELLSDKYEGELVELEQKVRHEAVMQSLLVLRDFVLNKPRR